MSKRPWVLKKEKPISSTESTGYAVPDFHIECTKSLRFMWLIWLVGGLIILSLGVVGMVVGIAAFYLFEHLTNKKMKMNLHLIFYTKRDLERDAYYAINLDTNELLFIEKITDREDSTSYCVFLTNVYDNFVEYVGKSAPQYRELINGLTPNNIGMLRKVQFGETDWTLVTLYKYKDGDKICLGCTGMSPDNRLYIKYIELSETDYDRYFGCCSDMRAVCYVFKDENTFAMDDANKPFCTWLNIDEVKLYLNIMECEAFKCNVLVESFISYQFVFEKLYSGNASSTDINMLLLYRHLSDGNDIKTFVPASFSEIPGSEGLYQLLQ